MEIKNICVSYDIDRNCPPKRASVTHVNDVNTRIIELTLRQGDDKLNLDSGCTASASIVERVTKKLIASGIECEISESGTVLIPVDNLHFRDKIDINIEVSVSDSSDGQVLTLPYPIWIRVNPSVLDEAEVTDKSLGTIPELIEEAKELVESYHYELTDEDAQKIAAEVDVTGKENTSNKKTIINNQSQTGDSDTNYPTVGAVRDFVNFVKDDLEDYVDDEIGATPQYVIDESESVLAKAFAHKGLGRTIRFIAVSDSHNDATKTSHDYTRVSNLHCGQAVKYIADRIPLDFVASLGDMTWAGVAHTTAQYQTDWLKADIQEMNMFLKDGFSGVPNIRCVGNHDQCATTGSGGTVSRLQNNGAYQYFGRYNAGVNDGLSNYGYYDIDNVKLRIIYLNTSDTVSTSTQGTLLGVSQEQKNWLCETLIDVNSKSDAANWKILLLSHAPLDMVSGIAADILIPYTNGGTYGSYTFTNHSAKIIGNCHGHTHCYNIGYISDVIRRFTIPNSNFYDNNHYKDNANYSAWNEDTTYPKTANSRTDTSFSLVTVDLDNLTCYVDNYGAGYDREFSLDYKSAPAPVNLFDKNDADVVLRARFNSSHVPASWDASQLITGFIEVTAGDTFTVSGDNTQNLNVYTGVAQLYNSNKEYIGIYSSPVQDPTHQKWVWAADYLSGSLDTSVAPNNGTNSGAAYIRFCLAYTNIDNLVITK
ncbi:metallophosphoesterase family protein [Ruminococcus sp. JL13D9]|uniref:metallophosphoesterase family protein n=1 Tax=Ruminococcus sp. JL13D9 TaxID=3233381 RepID=UPI003899D374